MILINSDGFFVDYSFKFIFIIRLNELNPVENFIARHVCFV